MWRGFGSANPLSCIAAFHQRADEPNNRTGVTTALDPLHLSVTMQQQPMHGLLLALLLLACGSCCMAPGARGVLATEDSSATAAVHQPGVPHAQQQHLRKAHQQQQQQLHGGKHGGLHGGLHGGPHHLQPVTVFLPYCAQLAANLPPADQAHLRAKVQQVSLTGGGVAGREGR